MITTFANDNYNVGLTRQYIVDICGLLPVSIQDWTWKPRVENFVSAPDVPWSETGFRVRLWVERSNASTPGIE